MASSEDSERRARSELTRYSGVGLHFAATVAFFAWIGWWADGRLESEPWLLLVGVFAGFGLGLYTMITKLVPPVSAKKNEKKSP